MMKKLLKTYKSLPREIKTLVAMAGLASPIGFIYLLQRFVFRGMPLIYVIAIVAGALAVFGLIGWLVARMFGRGGARRSKRMADELAREDSQGPVSVDVRASIKANNEKFFNHVRAMKKTLDISVYDLPWYIVMGDSGCGKTKLVNNGGLTFSMGKPEGYQLGTLNYNWWFSDDAVFVDMAGRLCNPQEDADHREWEAFLNTVARGRKGFPINGALLCISADHLLQDSPEKHESDANIALERLREMQSRLGVTFATYLVITKCDKILGFMQFFDRAVRDLKVKNQIFGWSKPGEFNKIYDPEAFNPDFEALYFRLNELRMRRLNDEGVDEIDRGLAYSFPEEFRELREPLQTYLRTIFAPIKHVGAIKNLIFRGIYFTSATQEGELILKHLTERLGAEAANQFPTLDSLYPEKRPLFVKELLFQKVFPEHGLVFRNEADVIRNRSLSRLLTIGSVALAVILGVTLYFSASALNRLINKPRDHAQTAVDKLTDPDGALEHVATLTSDIDSLKGNLGAARLLLVWDTSKPVRDLRTIRGRLFEKGILNVAFGDVGEALRSEILIDVAPGDAEKTVEERIAALREYVRWYGCRKQSSVPAALTRPSLDDMCKIVDEDGSVTMRESFSAEASHYFDAIHDPRTEWRNPAGLLPGEDAGATIQEAIRQIHQYFKGRYAMLDGSANQVIAAWMRILDRCATIDRSYGAILSEDPESIRTPERLRAFTESFVANHDEFEAALNGVAGPLGLDDVTALEEALLALRARWTGFDAAMREAYGTCQESDADLVLPSLERGGGPSSLESLDLVMWERLHALGLTKHPWAEHKHDYFSNRATLDQAVDEVYEVFGHIVTYVPKAGLEKPRVDLTASAKQVGDVLRGIRRSLSGASGAEGGAAGRDLFAWATSLNELLEQEQARGAGVPPGLPEKWMPDKLARLDKGYLSVRRLIEIQSSLTQLHRQLEGLGEWSVAELYDDYGRGAESTFAMPLPTRSQPAQTPTVAKEGTPPSEAETPRRRGLSALFDDDEKKAPAPTSAPSVPEAVPSPSPAMTAAIPQCATPDFMNRIADHWVALAFVVQAFREGDYLGEGTAGRPLHLQCYDQLRTQWRRYAEKYAASWRQAYEAKVADRLDALLQSGDWETFAGQFTAGSQRGLDWQEAAAAMESALKEVLRATRWATFQAERRAFWGEYGNEAIRPLHREIAITVSDALGQAGPRGSFVQNARAEGLLGVAQDRQPWESLTAAFRDSFMELVNGLGGCTELRQRVEVTTRGAPFPEIPWGRAARLREEARLNDEMITGHLVRFEEHALGLLNRELSSILARTQEDAFGTQGASGGWPFLGSAGHATGSLETVEFDTFRRFLAKVRHAGQLFEKLESGLERHMPNDPVRQQRMRFYQQCGQWYEFLGLEGDVGSLLPAKPLTVRIKGGDPEQDPVFSPQIKDTAQMHYSHAELTIGLRLTDGSSGGTIQLDTQGIAKFTDRTAVWDWNRSGADPAVTIALRDPIRPNLPEQLTDTLGRSSPLAFCAYLQNYGREEERSWRTLLKFPLDSVSGERGQYVGEMFIFDLDRPMPKPIASLPRL